MPARVRVHPGDIHPDAAARRMGMTPAEFAKVLPRLLARGFPPADPDTGMFDLDAIDTWRRRRHAALYGLTAAPAALDARGGIVRERLEALRGGHGEDPALRRP